MIENNQKIDDSNKQEIIDEQTKPKRRVVRKRTIKPKSSTSTETKSKIDHTDSVISADSVMIISEIEQEPINEIVKENKIDQESKKSKITRVRTRKNTTSTNSIAKKLKDKPVDNKYVKENNLGNTSQVGSPLESSVEKSMQKPNFAFVDCQNLWVNKDRNWHLDWQRFRDYLRKNHNIERAYLFIGYINGYQKMYQQLQEAGFILIFKQVQEVNGEFRCNVDTEMVMHAMIQYDNYDQAVIVSGDGDFTCLVEHLRVNGKLEKLLIPGHRSYSQVLEKTAKGRVDFVSNLRSEIAKTEHINQDSSSAQNS